MRPRSEPEIDAAFTTFAEKRARALFVGAGPFLITHGKKIVTPGGARAHRPPHTAPRGAFRGSKKKPLPIERGQDQTRLHLPLFKPPY
jgi:hypothetical protein